MAEETSKKLKFFSWQKPDRAEQAKALIDGMLKLGSPIVSKDGIISRLRFDKLGIRTQAMSKDNLLAEIHLTTEYYIQKWEKEVDKQGKPLMDKNGKPIQRIGTVIGDVHRHLLNVIYGMPWPDNGLWDTRGVMKHPIINRNGDYVIRNGLTWYKKNVNGFSIKMPKIHLADGYDPITKYFFAIPDNVMAELEGIENQKPTDNDVIEALDFISDFLCDFEFETDSARASAVAFMLTMLCRELVEGSIPMLEIRAAESQTGKSLLAKMMIEAVTGERPSLFSPNFYDKSEFEKELLSVLMRGRNYVFMDNVKGTVDSSMLDMGLTSSFIEKRLLNTNDVATVYSGMPFVITGNNPKLSDDIRKRVYLLDLIKPKEGKKFKHNKPEVYALKSGPKMLRSLFTLYNHWNINEKRKLYTQRRMDGFIEWSAIIGGILQSVGIFGFLDDTVKQIREVDPKYMQASDMAEAWYAVYKNKWLQVKETVSFATEAGYVKGDETFQKKVQTINVKLNQMRMVKLPGGYRFEKTEFGRGSQWRVMKDE